MKMNAETAGWSRRYQVALRRHLKLGPSASVQPALRLGRQAVALGLETLDLALIHEQALASLAAPGGIAKARQRLISRAKTFFDEAVVPIEKTHGAALRADVRVNQLTQKLQRRTVESSASTRHLEQSILKRQAAEAALKKSGNIHVKLLKESRALQNRLRSQTREILSAQEEEKQKTSRELQDEIAQILVAVNFGLLALKASAKASTNKIEKEIINTQRLVRASVKRINRFAHEFNTQHKV